jgi:hypothetical protein
MDCLNHTLAHDTKESERSTARLIVIPDFMNSSGSSKMIEAALNFAEFDVNVCTRSQAAWAHPRSRRQKKSYQVNGREFPKGVLHSRANHSESFLVSGVSAQASR